MSAEEAGVGGSPGRGILGVRSALAFDSCGTEMEKSKNSGQYSKKGYVVQRERWRSQVNPS